jgi:hypothetical protein
MAKRKPRKPRRTGAPIRVPHKPQRRHALRRDKRVRKYTARDVNPGDPLT